MAAAIETAIVVAVLAGAARHVQHDEPVVLSVNLMTPTAPPVEPAAVAKPDVPPPRAKSLSLPEAALPVVPEPAPAPPANVASPVTQPMAHTVEPVAAPVAPPPPPAASAAPSTEYIAKVRAAVQGAFEYPMAAKAEDFKGRARVAFTLKDTRPGNARIMIGSGMSIVDKAALRAVEGASYPPAPEALSHVEQAFEVWVSFGA
jgi:TonB family protein